MSHPTIRRCLHAGVLMLACSFSVSCTDPVKDRAIERLGGEDPAVPMGPEHRPGQPCVLCHSEGGPAADKPFVIAGTIFESNSKDAKGAEGVQIFFIDAASATRNYETNAAGNFFIPQAEWNDLTFPFKTGIVAKDGKQFPMTSTVNREGSCNFCHKPTPGSPYSLPTDDPRESIGQIYASTPGSMGGSQ
ncbi:MAG: uncharacterized protein JWP87_6494 [Labilithrix sp.]|nr:uncharacterized protein [Labilithrix sp.]